MTKVSWVLTDEDIAYIFYWDEKAIDYATKVAFPVESDIIGCKLTEISNCKIFSSKMIHHNCS